MSPKKSSGDSNKEIGEKGVQFLKKHLEDRYREGIGFENISNKGGGQHYTDPGYLGCDAIATIAGEKRYFEVKASKSNITQIKVTHQCVFSMLNAHLLDQLIIVVIPYVDNVEKRSIQFYRYGDIPAKNTLLEMKFCVKLDTINRKFSDIGEILSTESNYKDNVTSIFDKKGSQIIKEHVEKRFEDL